jgi:hypothetical protein
VRGDNYGGEWPKERFAAHGISYELSDRNKSSIYQDFLPSLNGQRVRLLDQARLIGQLCNLERRVSRGGRDSIDHAPGAHDDVANSVCGVLTAIINDRRPALIRHDDLLQDGCAIALPAHVDVLFAVLVVAQDGSSATVYAGYSPAFFPPLALLDFVLEPMSRDCFPAIAHRLTDLAKVIRVRKQAPFVLVAPELLEVATAWGCPAVTHDLMLADPAQLALIAAGHVGAGRVRITVQAATRAQVSPLHGALNFRSGEDVNAPLQRAVILATVASLGGEPSRGLPH